MPLLLSGVSIDGRVLTSIVSSASSTYSLYFPEGNNQMIKNLGAITSVRLNDPYPGVWREEQFRECWTWCTAFRPTTGGSDRRIVLQFRAEGMAYEVWS